MLVQYSNAPHEKGRIIQIVLDLVPEGLPDQLRSLGIPFLDIPVQPLPDAPVFHPVTGEPVIDEGTGEQLIAPAGYTQLSVDPAKDYVFDEAITDRPPIVAPNLVEVIANGVDQKVIENLPDGSTLTIDGVVHELVGTTLTIISDMQAEYDINVQKFPYVDHKIKVIARAA